MIIAITGSIGSGKDTVADYLSNFHEFRRESFASSLKDAISFIFGWDRTLLEGRTKESREWREQPDSWWSKRLGMDITPRFILQNWGTEVCRNGFHQDIWIASLENKLRTSKDNIVISDCRFPNEFAAIQKLGGKIIRVKRGPEPTWYKDVKDAVAGDKCSNSVIATQKLKDLGIHYSEWAWYGLEFDHVIENNSTIDELYNRVNDLIIDQDVNLPDSTLFLHDAVSVDSWRKLF